MIACRNLRVEHLVAPIGIGATRPRFSWLLEGATQAGFELEVRNAAGDLVWVSGRRDSDEHVLVEYDGAPIASGTAYRWRVRAWGAGADVAGRWAESSFETGLQPADWVASWVRPPQQPAVIERWTLPDWIFGRGPASPPAERLRPSHLLRQRFVLDGSVARARLHATAHGVCTVRMNGVAADDQVLAPGFDSYDHILSVQTYDVTALLREGENVLAVTLADGWWAGRVGLTGSSAQWGDTTSAIWQLHVEYADGSHVVVPSGADVRAAEGPHRYADLFVGEQFDARAVQHGWDEPGFDDARWSAAEPSGESTRTLTPFVGEPVRRVLELPPAHIGGDVDAGWLVDFGQVVAGRIRLRMPEAAAGTTVTIEHTETLDVHGAWFQNIIGINKDQTDVYIAAGRPGGETYEPDFTFHGFRYARIRGLERPPATDEVTAVVLSSDLESAGSFHCSDDRLNRLHENVVWSQRANFLSVPTDCPQRERAGWTGDIQVFAPAATNNAGSAAFLTRWLANLRADLLPDGRVPIVSPRSRIDAEQQEAGSGIAGIVAAAGWSDAIAIVPWVLFERYGDRRVLEQNYAAMTGWVEYQRATAESALPAALAGRSLTPERRARQALLYNTGDHFGDWLTPSTMRGRPLHEAIGIAPALTSELVAPMFQANTLTLVARIAALLGHTDDADRYAERAAAVRAAFADEYVGDGRLASDLQGPHVLALAFDMVPEAMRAGVADRLAELVTDNGDRLDTGFLSVPYLLDVLWDTGHRDLARRVLWQSELPSWLYEVDHGATTIWESWDAISPDGEVRPVSLNHYAFGCVDDWLFRRIAGIEATEPGYRSVRVEPDVDCGLAAVQAHRDTPYGRVAVAWTRSGDEVELTVDAPTGMHVQVLLGDVTRAVEPGRTVIRVAHVCAEEGALA